MSSRAFQVLSRLPIHLEASRPGKQFEVAADAVARSLDDLAAAVAAIRRSHRLGHANELTDLDRLGGLHGLDEVAFGPLTLREARLEELTAALEAALEVDDEAGRNAAAALLAFFAIPGGQDRLALFGPPPVDGGESELKAAGRELVRRTRQLLDYGARLERRRRRVRSLAAIHARGNATVRSLLVATASALDLELDLERNRAIQESWRPRVTVSQDGETGQTIYAYRVVARSRSKNVDRISDIAITRSGPAPLGEEKANLLTWDPPPDARDILVFRVGNEAEPEAVGLLTPEPLSPLASAFRDTTAALPEGVEAGRLPDAEPEDDLFHSRDGFWHASAVRPMERLVRPVEVPREEGEAPTEPRRRLTVEGGITLRSLAAATGGTVDRLMELAADHGVEEAAPGVVLTAEQAARVADELGFAVEEVLPAAQEFLGLEENPLRREEAAVAARRHGELFVVYRRGFGRSLLRAQITALADRTVGPMLVNRDEGRGIGLACNGQHAEDLGTLAEGAELVFEEGGRATLDGTDVTAHAFAWRGACFAGNDDDPTLPRDFVFAREGEDPQPDGVDPRRLATFAVASPAGALEPGFLFPHAGNDLPVPGIGVGRTRFGFFVQQAHFSGSDRQFVPPRAVPPVLRTHAGFADRSVFAAEVGEALEPAAEVSLSWLEHEAYVVRVLLPRRLAVLEQEKGQEGEAADNGEEKSKSEGKDILAPRVRQALERHRAAGVDVRVEYVDERWTLGESHIGPAEAGDPILSLRAGSVLSEAPEPSN